MIINQIQSMSELHAVVCNIIHDYHGFSEKSIFKVYAHTLRVDLNQIEALAEQIPSAKGLPERIREIGWQVNGSLWGIYT